MINCGVWAAKVKNNRIFLFILSLNKYYKNDLETGSKSYDAILGRKHDHHTEF